MKKVLSYVKNNKGFTLIELLAVIVILAILMLVASTNVFNILDNARRGSFRTEFLSLLEAAETTASMDLMDGDLSQTNNTICYSLNDPNSELVRNYSNNNNYKGSVSVTLNADGSLSTTGWLAGDYYYVDGKNDELENNDSDIPPVSDANLPSDNELNNCGNPSP